MTQAQKIAEAERLKGEGLSVRQIAKRMGYGKSTVGEWLRPHFCSCGKRRSHGHEQCWECHAITLRTQSDERMQQIEAWWQEGLSIREMAERMGWEPRGFTGYMDRMRSRGYDLPYRHKHHKNKPVHSDQVAA